MMKHVRCFWLGLLLVLQPFSPVVGASDAESVIRQATQDIYHALEQECELIGKQPEHLYVLVDRLLIPHADFQRMSQWVLGKHWRDASADQRSVFVQQFHNLLIRTYATAIQLASLEDIQYLPMRESANPGRATVRAEIRRPGEPMVSISYALYQKGADWLVYDILVDGVSLVSNYRTAFADEIRSQGFDRLIESMKEKNRQPMTADTAAQIKSRRAGGCNTQLH